MAPKLTGDVAAVLEVQVLQRCGPLNLTDISYEAKTDIRENDELGSFAAGAAREVFDRVPSLGAQMKSNEAETYPRSTSTPAGRGSEALRATGPC